MLIGLEFDINMPYRMSQTVGNLELVQETEATKSGCRVLPIWTFW